MFVTSFSYSFQVAERLASLAEVSSENQTFLDAHTSSMKCVAIDAKNKWDNFVLQANNSFDDGSNYVSTEHCQMETVFQQWLLFSCLNVF